MHKIRKLNLEPSADKLRKKLREFGIAQPIVYRIVENCGSQDWKQPANGKTAWMLAPRAERLSEAWQWLHSLADSIGWKRMHELSEVLLLLHDISERSGYTRYGHQLRTMKYARIILEELGLLELGRRREMSAIMLGALFHDVGKSAMRHCLLRKHALNEKEEGHIKTHPYCGKKILEGLLCEESAEAKTMIRIAHCHHKHADGGGYPARAKDCYSIKEYLIVGFADAFDAMTSYRIYQESKTIKEALETMSALSGMQFGRKISEAFVSAAAKKHRLAEIADIVIEGGGKPF